jgi:hypothetical protein
MRGRETCGIARLFLRARNGTLSNSFDIERMGENVMDERVKASGAGRRRVDKKRIESFYCSCRIIIESRKVGVGRRCARFNPGRSRRNEGNEGGKPMHGRIPCYWGCSAGLLRKVQLSPLARDGMWAGERDETR